VQSSGRTPPASSTDRWKVSERQDDVKPKMSIETATNNRGNCRSERPPTRRRRFGETAFVWLA
jgi:hypothetical protein